MKLRHALTLFLAGCGSSSSPATASGPDASSDASAAMEGSAPDTSTPEDGATVDATTSDSASDGGPPCNAIANTAPVVPITQIAAAPPTPQGGAIADGTYWETSLDIYTGTAGPAGMTGTSQTTALIQGTTVQLVSDGQPTRRTVVLTTADAGFTSVDTCPDSQMSQGGYTATSTTLTIFLPGGTDDAGARTVVETLTKQ
jgi:hypothetical protein